MECKDCKYRREGFLDICDISHRVLNHPMGRAIKECSLESDLDVESMDICYNCESWIGGGDWGLSCKEDYYNTSANGFDKVCEKFRRKNKQI